MLWALLAAAAVPETAVDAERAFYRAAQTEGQWTAFRRFAAPDATIFTPQPARALDALPRIDPPIAVQWWPAQSYVSCDGTMAVNTGPWVRPDGFGYFTTVWQHQADGGWKWRVDAGDAAARPRPLPEKPQVRRAACSGAPSPFQYVPFPGERSDSGGSADGTLVWYWRVRDSGERTFETALWNGHGYDRVIRDDVAAPR